MRGAVAHLPGVSAEHEAMHSVAKVHHQIRHTIEQLHGKEISLTESAAAVYLPR